MIDKRLMREGEKVSIYIILTVALGIALALLAVIQAYYVSNVIAQVFLEKQTLEQVWNYLLIILGVIGIRGVLQLCQEISAKEASIRVKTDLRERFIHKLLLLGPLYTRGEREGELINTAVEGIENLDDYFARYIPQLVIAVAIPVIILIFVFPIDFTSGLILLLTGPLIPFFMMLIGRIAEKKSLAQWQSLSRMSAHFLDVLKGLTTLKVFGRSKDQEKVIFRVSESFRKASLSVLKIAFLSSFVLEFFAMLSTALVAVTLGIRLIDGGIGYREALFLLILAPEYYQPLRTLGAQFHARMSGINAADRIYGVLDLEEYLEDKLRRKHEGKLISDKTMGEDLANQEVDTEGKILNKKWDDEFSKKAEEDHMSDEANVLLQFKNVFFKYDKDSELVLRDLSFQVRAGERVAIVGPSGAGKTTILNLILGFIKPTRGEIVINNRNLAYVSQKPYLFAGSIIDNLRVGNENASEEEIIDAAQKALAHELIMNLPNGYMTYIGEGGVSLSGGQMQRLAIARAFLKEAPLLLLDEPTSGLDYKNEQEVQLAIDNLMEERTVIYIAHKMKTVENAHRIILLDKGQIKEEGTHDELIALGGMYAEFVEEYRGRDR